MNCGGPILYYICAKSWHFPSTPPTTSMIAFDSPYAFLQPLLFYKAPFSKFSNSIHFIHQHHHGYTLWFCFSRNIYYFYSVARRHCGSLWLHPHVASSFRFVSQVFSKSIRFLKSYTWNFKLNDIYKYLYTNNAYPTFDE